MKNKLRDNNGSLRRLYTLDSRPLHAQLPFWYALLGPVVAATLIFCHTYNGVEHLWQVSDQEEILKESKFALLALALSPIFTSIVTNFHRTIQTNTQILATGKKNVVEAYIAHQKVCNENLSHIRDKLHIDAMPSDRASKFEEMPISERQCLNDTELNEFYNVLVLKYEHVKLNLLYDKFFPENSLENGVTTYKPRDILPDILGMIDSTLNNLLHDEPYAILSHYIDEWDMGGHDRSSAFIPLKIDNLLRDFGPSSFRHSSIYCERKPGVFLTEYVVNSCSLLKDYFTVVEISIENRILHTDIFDLFFGDSYVIHTRFVASYITKATLHILEISVAMGSRENIEPIIKRVKVIDRLISYVDTYLGREDVRWYQNLS